MNKFAYMVSKCVLIFTKPLSRFLMGINTYLTVMNTIAGLKPRPDDIFLATYPKSGTTWLQMIMFQLTTDGDLDKISHLSHAIQHLEESQVARPVDLESLPGPRVFKTHLQYKHLPKGGKVIHVARNGMDVANSFFHHHQSILGYRGTFPHFFQAFLAGRVPYGSWFLHMAGWLEQKAQPNILFLNYEDMKKDLAGTIEKIVNFCDLKVEPEQMPRILERCSFEYMKNHQDKMDIVSLTLANKGLTPNQLIRKGEAGQGAKQLDEAQRAEFKKLYDTHLAQFDQAE